MASNQHIRSMMVFQKNCYPKKECKMRLIDNLMKVGNYQGINCGLDKWKENLASIVSPGLTYIALIVPPWRTGVIWNMTRELKHKMTCSQVEPCSLALNISSIILTNIYDITGGQDEVIA